MYSTFGESEKHAAAIQAKKRGVALTKRLAPLILSF